MSEQKRAAVVKRGADREQRDMFAVGAPDLGSVKQTIPPPAPDGSGGVAARNETSVLFTVDALRGSARVKTPAGEMTPFAPGLRVEEDEGIIDLKALSSSPPAVGSRVIAPLFSEPPPAAFTADVSGSSPAIAAGGGFRLGKRAIAGFAAASVALAICAFGLAAAFRGEEPVARTNALMPPASLPAPGAAVAAPVPAPAPMPAPPATASSNDDDAKSSAADKKGGKGKAGKGKGKATFSANVSKVQSSGVAPVKPAPKAADKCGCKGDFNCVIRCTATGK